MDPSLAQTNNHTGNHESPKEMSLETHEFGTVIICSELSKPSEDVHIEQVEISNTISNCTIIAQSGPRPTMTDVRKDDTPEQLGLPLENMANNFNDEELGSTVEVEAKNEVSQQKGQLAYMTNNVMAEDVGQSPENAKMDFENGNLGSHLEDAHKIFCTKQLGTPMEFGSIDSGTKLMAPPLDDAFTNSTCHKLDAICQDGMSVSERTSPKSSRKRKILPSVRSTDRALRTRSQEKPKSPEPSNDVADDNVCKVKKRKKRRKEKKILADEFSKIRNNCRYFLNRMKYEQNYIDVYSGEGWKKQSVDKLKPEKELQRAASEILRCKRKIREIVERLDSICGEGRLPESLFDSDGEIDSEDIFCAKCGSKELSAGNDIILCDGACDRGFHLLCLQPPLSLEEIPPDEEGWLCPACDCKVDCIGMLNDSQGITLSVTHSWEDVFPEVAASEGANEKIDVLASDDSEDDDYDPDAKVIDEKLHKDGSSSDDSSSDDSDFYSANEDLETPPGDEQLLGLPSDDSEDDDYDPTAPDADVQVNQDTVSSDFTSDSEDLGAIVDENRSSRKEKAPSSLSLNLCEPLSNVFVTLEETDFASVSGRRRAERLDYKKLYDEAYINVRSSSSDDDDWTDTEAPKKRKNNHRQLVQGLPSVSVPNSKIKKVSKGVKHSLNETENSSPVKLKKCSSSPRKKTISRKLGDDATQKLYTSFKENQFPGRAAKEKLAEELGMTVDQVSKWFGNARWSARHHPLGTGAQAGKNAENKETSSSEDHTKHPAPDPEKKVRDVICTPNSQKRKKSNLSNEETPKPNVDLSNAQ